MKWTKKSKGLWESDKNPDAEIDIYTYDKAKQEYLRPVRSYDDLRKLPDRLWYSVIWKEPEGTHQVSVMRTFEQAKEVAENVMKKSPSGKLTNPTARNTRGSYESNISIDSEGTSSDFWSEIEKHVVQINEETGTYFLDVDLPADRIMIGSYNIQNGTAKFTLNASMKMGDGREPYSRIVEEHDKDIEMMRDAGWNIDHTEGSVVFEDAERPKQYYFKKSVRFEKRGVQNQQELVDSLTRLAEG